MYSSKGYSLALNANPCPPGSIIFNFQLNFVFLFIFFHNEGKVYENKTIFKLFQWDDMIYIYYIPSQFLLPSPLKPKYI